MNVQRQIDRLVALQAAEWYERLKDGAGEWNAEFVHWVAESPRHMEAFLSVAGEAPLMRKVFAQGSFDLHELLQRTSQQGTALTLPFPIADKNTLTSTLARNQGKNARQRRPVWATAAVLATVAIGAALYTFFLPWQRFETPVGEQRTIQLTEGSIVNLNAQSRMDVRIDDSQRDIRLSSGEATFKVAQDRARPFRVHTPSAVVEAVGTSFNVYARPDGSTKISVLEGKVKVSSRNSADAGQSVAPIPLAAGEEAQVRASGAIERHRNPDVAEAVAWQQRKLIFKRTPLEDMVAEFNRYNKASKIRLEGIAPGTFRFTGAFNADDSQSLAVLLMREPDLTIERHDDEILIRSKKSEQAKLSL